MALMRCPECGRMISDQAVSCPGCGYPMTTEQDPEEARREAQLAAAREKDRVLLRRVGLLLLLGILVILGAVVAAARAG